MSLFSLRLRGWWLVFCVGGGFGPQQLLAGQSLSAEQVMQKALARAQPGGTGARQPAYGYTRITLTEEFGPDGKMREHKEKVYKVCQRDGSTEVRLLSVNGRPPGQAERKQQAENESTARRLMGGSGQGGDANQEQVLTPELVARFDFTLLDQESLNGRLAYRLRFAPKQPEPPVHRLADRLADRLWGTIWIDAQEFELARAELRLGSEVNLLGGMLGSLKRLAYTITRTRVADGLWLNSSAKGDFEGRRLLEPLRIKTTSQNSNFHPLAMNAAGPAAQG